LGVFELKDFTIDELMVTCMAREVEDGSIILQGLTTPLATVAYYLAKATHAPNAYLYQLAGNILTYNLKALPVSMMFNEFQAMSGSLYFRSQMEAYETIFTKSSSIVEFFRPAQIDKYGNVNNSVIGDYESPKVRLPGAFGIPDALGIYPKILVYCPRHEKRVFVEKVDFISGVGIFDRDKSSNKEIRIISNLGTFRLDNKTKEMQLITKHPGVNIEEIKENTSFDLMMPKSIEETKPPTEDQIDLIRDKIDPNGTRRLEMLSGKERLSLLLDIIKKESKTK
jgi:acyl CoA:acetate/3-ketoacid CoA transferase beta subunit